MWHLLSYLAACNLGPAQLTVLIDGSAANVHTLSIPGEPQCWAAVVQNVQFNNRGHLPTKIWTYTRSGLNVAWFSVRRCSEVHGSKPRCLIAAEYKSTCITSPYPMHAVIRTWTDSSEGQQQADAGANISAAAATASAVACTRTDAATLVPATRGAGTSASSSAGAGPSTTTRAQGTAVADACLDVDAALAQGLLIKPRKHMKIQKEERWIDRKCWILCGEGPLPNPLIGLPATTAGAETDSGGADCPTQNQQTGDLTRAPQVVAFEAGQLAAQHHGVHQPLVNTPQQHRDWQPSMFSIVQAGIQQLPVTQHPASVSQPVISPLFQTGMMAQAQQQPQPAHYAHLQATHNVLEVQPAHAPYHTTGILPISCPYPDTALAVQQSNPVQSVSQSDPAAESGHVSQGSSVHAVTSQSSQGRQHRNAAHTGTQCCGGGNMPSAGRHTANQALSRPFQYCCYTNYDVQSYDLCTDATAQRADWREVRRWSPLPQFPDPEHQTGLEDLFRSNCYITRPQWSDQ